MTPEERDLVTELFSRLAQLESAPRDREAEAAINDGLRKAPHAIYALVQTILVQDEALKRADAHILELESQSGPQSEPVRSGGGFLDNMRGSLFGQREEPRSGSVPSVPRAGETPWGQPGGGGGSYPPGGGGGFPPGGGGGFPGAGGGYMGAEPMRPGGSFLGNMAASAAGMIGGSLLLDGMRSMMGHRPGGGGSPPSGGGTSHAAASPWGGSEGGGAGGGGLGRDAGLDDIGRGRSTAQNETDSGQSRGLFDNTSSESDDQADFDDDIDGEFDDDGGDDGEN